MGQHDEPAEIVPDASDATEANSRPDDAPAESDASSDAARCACWRNDAELERRTELDCLCRSIYPQCSSDDYDALVARYSRPFGCGYPNLPRLTARTSEYPDCKLVTLFVSGSDAPGETWVFDAETRKLVGLNYQPGLADGYGVDLCTGERYFGLPVAAGILPNGCRSSNETDLCPVDAGPGR